MHPLPQPIAAVAYALRDLRATWAVAGGWAIDLALGRATREHADVDIAVFRDEQGALRAALPGWRFAVAIRGSMAPWPEGERLSLPVHEVHAHPPAGPPVEFLLNERGGAEWVYRRDPGVRRPLARALREGPSGVALLAPEIVLLYKSKAPRPADEHDFAVAQPLLDADARAWLRTALLRADPAHRWAAALTPPHD
ncbi:MAG: amino acid transporter [Gemmatimonadetes bacterium]|nr:amino acid transporter [Gemmatimonadota bacterium]